MSRELTETVAWELVDRAVEVFDLLDVALRERVVSMVVFNSLVRGDFVTNVSDIDVLIVFDSNPRENVVDKIRECFIDLATPYHGKSNSPYVFDIPWVIVTDIPLKESVEREPSPLKFLGIYAFDFVNHSRVLRGRDFRHDLLVQDPKTLVQSRGEDLRNKWIGIKAEDRRKVVLITGELIRLAQINYGKSTLDKHEVLNHFKKFVPHFEGKDFIDVFWEEYLTGGLRKMDANSKTEYFIECESFTEKLFELLGC